VLLHAAYPKRTITTVLTASTVAKISMCDEESHHMGA
jgi:hypothetical protein